MGLTCNTDEQYYAVTQSFALDSSSTDYTFTLGEELTLNGDNVFTWTPATITGSSNIILSNPSVGPDYSDTNFYLETSPDGSAPWTLYDGVNNFSSYFGPLGSVPNVAYPNPNSNGSVGIGQGGQFSVNNNIITFGLFNVLGGATPAAGVANPTTTYTYYFRIRLKNPDYGDYAYVSINDIINNFLVAYVGAGKLIPSVKRTDILFHAQRAVQEFSYDTLKSIKSQELTVPSSLSVIIPKDYVNYVKISRIDDSGVKHIIYPTRLTINPSEIPVQDSDGVPTQGEFGNNIEGDSVTEERWKALDSIDSDYDSGKQLLGQRYGLNPETTHVNDWFTINDREGTIMFSSGLSEKLIVLEYISDGISCNGDTRIPKLAEEAMYMHIAYSILAGRVNVPEYIVQRFKKDRRAALRNAKLRLSNIKLEEITQVLKGKSKQIK